MKRYVKNVLIYIAALFGVVAFICIFIPPLRIFDSIKQTWYNYPVRAYLGNSISNTYVYKGTPLPIIGFALPFVMSVILIVESFQPSWSKSISVLNTALAVLYFISAILALLTKELFLKANDLGNNLLLKNGVGTITSAILSTIAGILLLIVTWVPSDKELDFIEK